MSDPNKLLDKFLKEHKEDHYNFEEAFDYRISSGSLLLDMSLGGGFGPGLHRFTGMNEGGKEQPVYAPVLTPSGWRQIGSLKVGDTVYNSQGNEQTVLGVFPQGKKDVYKVDFDDGSSVLCGIEHLWETSSFTERHAGRKSVKPLSDIINTLRYGKNLNHSVRLVKPIQHAPKKFSIQPYTLGALLGDGGLTESASITSADQEIFDRVFNEIKLIFGDFSLSTRDKYTKNIIFNKAQNPVHSELRRLDLFGKKSHEKFIPTEYLFGSVAQRLELLQGLIDTDGYISPKKSETLFYSTSKTLSHQTLDLVRSLGGLGRIRYKKSSYKNKDGKRVICKDCWIVSFYLFDDMMPATLDRKLANYSKRQLNRCHFISNVEKISKAESVCIKVSSLDSLYVTENYVLTHNTSEALEVMRNFCNSEKRRGLYIKAEGRLPKEMAERSGVNFVYDADKWVDGTCFVFESNIYETVMDLMRELVKAKDGLQYCFIVDSVDGLIAKNDLDKSLEESAKVAGGAVIASAMMKKISIALAKRGHMAIFTSQVRADIKLDPYSRAPIRQTTSTGGNALLHFANWILEFEPRFQKDMILKNGKAKFGPDNPPIGHFAKVTIKKSPNEKTNTIVSYPIQYGQKGGKSIWKTKEVVDMLLAWELVEKRGAWIRFTQELEELLGMPISETSNYQLQGEANLFKHFDDNPADTKILYNYFVQMLSE